MEKDTLKKRIEKWAKRVGPRKAQVALVTAGCSPSTAEKLAAGRYGSSPKGETAFALEKLLKREEKEQAS